MTGVLRAKVNGVWVDILGSGGGDGESGGPAAGSSWVLTPAEAGPRGAQARFGHISGSDQAGFIMYPGGNAEVRVGSTDKWFDVYDTAGNYIAYFEMNNNMISPWLLSNTHSGACLGRAGVDQTVSYNVLSLAGSLFLNSDPGCTINFRIGNASIGSTTASTWTINPTLSCNAISCSTINTNGQTITSGALNTGAIGCGNINAGTGTLTCGTINASGGVGAVVFGSNAGNRTSNWSGAHFTAYNPAGDYHGARVGLYSSGAAAQWWVGYPNGANLCAMNDQNSGTVAIVAAAFNVGSALAIKKDVRTLRPERERITVQRDPASDLVAQPDIMALRPVAFRQRQLMQLDGEDYPADTVLGRETRRERLGLVADEVQHVIPSSVIHNTDNEVVGIDYAQITVALLDHVQELTRTVETLRYRIAELEGA